MDQEQAAPGDVSRRQSDRLNDLALPPASQMVADYLAAMERRDMETARSYLADEFLMTFPGGVSFRELTDLIDWAKARYRSAGKIHERFDEVHGPSGDVVVYCLGTLYGEWLDGTPFADIRYIDRFTVTGGKLIRQQVWNDMAEVRSQMPTPRH